MNKLNSSFMIYNYTKSYILKSFFLLIYQMAFEIYINCEVTLSPLYFTFILESFNYCQFKF